MRRAQRSCGARNRGGVAALSCDCPRVSAGATLWVRQQRRGRQPRGTPVGRSHPDRRAQPKQQRRTRAVKTARPPWVRGRRVLSGYPAAAPTGRVQQSWSSRRAGNSAAARTPELPPAQQSGETGGDELAWSLDRQRVARALGHEGGLVGGVHSMEHPNRSLLTPRVTVCRAAPPCSRSLPIRGRGLSHHRAAVCQTSDRLILPGGPRR